MAAPDPVTDHYDVLGLAPGASARDVKRAYKKLALKFHPDRRPGPTAEAVLRRLNEAYAVLRDPKRREHYDWLRQQRQRQTGSAPCPPPPAASASARPREPEDERRWRGEGRVRRAYARTTAAKARREGKTRIASHAEAMRNLEAAFEAERGERRPSRRWLPLVFALLGLAAALLAWQALP